MFDPETDYYLRRSKEEAHRALTAQVPEAAAAHHALCVRYSARALMLLSEEDADRKAFPQLDRGPGASRSRS